MFSDGVFSGVVVAQESDPTRFEKRAERALFETYILW